MAMILAAPLAAAPDEADLAAGLQATIDEDAHIATLAYRLTTNAGALCPDQAYQHTYLADTIGRTLSPRERVCIRHRLNGLSYEDIGRSMGISTNTVGVLINRAFKKVKAA